MNVTRESISVALLNLLESNAQLAALIKTFSRIPRTWDNINEAERPCLTLFKGGAATESFVQPQDTRLGLTKYRIAYNLWLTMTADPSSTVLAETVLNNISDALDAALQAPVKGQKQTLGGLVNNAWLDGGTEWGRELLDTNVTVFWRILVETGI